MTSSETSARPPQRRWLARALVLLASLLAFLAIFSIWINRQLLNTENWTGSSAEMLENPVIRDQTARYLTDQLYANVDVQGEISAALPPVLQGLAGPAAGLLRDQVEKGARQTLADPRAQKL